MEKLVLEKVEAQLSSYTLRGKVRSDQMIATMARGVLLICLAEVLGVRLEPAGHQLLRC